MRVQIPHSQPLCLSPKPVYGFTPFSDVSTGPKDEDNVIRVIVRLMLCCSVSLGWSNLTLRDIWKRLR